MQSDLLRAIHRVTTLEARFCSVAASQVSVASLGTENQMPMTPLLDLAKETKYVVDAAAVPQRRLEF